MNIVRIAFFGDVVGRPGRSALKSFLPKFKSENRSAILLVNGENAAGGLGLDLKSAEEIFAAGADLITLGDHTWQRKEIRAVFEKYPGKVVRPLNYPPGAPGEGIASLTVGGSTIRVINLMGRVFMNGALDCPFRAIDSALALHPRGGITVVDMHAEATSEKVAMGRHLDGRVSLVVGTHTHIQTADEQVLTRGTGYITDLGMCGANNSIIGMENGAALGRFLSGMPTPYEVGDGPGLVQGVVSEIDPATGRAVAIERIRQLITD